MDNNFENNTNTEENSPDPNISETEKPVYTDPNADAREEGQGTESGFGNTYGGEANAQNESSSEPNNNYQGYWDNQSQDTQSQDTQYNQNTQSQDNQNTQYNQYNQNTQYSDQYSQNTQYSAGGSNYSYNVNPNQPYNGEEGYDTTPMSMGDWLLTLLAALIPCCGGIILYFVWAFSKKGNLNRRNYCRAALIIQGAGIVICIIMWIIMGSALFSALGYYY